MTVSRQETLFDISAPIDPTDSSGEIRSDLDRLEIVYGELGFVPQSRSELTEAMLALDSRDTPGGYATHLNEVLRHQQKSVSQDPPAALRSIVGTIKGFAATTRGDRTTLLAVSEELSEYAGNQKFLELDNVSSLNGWSLQPGTKRGLGLINRQLAVEKAIREGEWGGIDGFDKEESIAGMMAGSRVYEAIAGADAALIGAEKRHEFWINCLEQATNHLAVRAVAVGALKSLGVTYEK
jgi:hypothetical protein